MENITTLLLILTPLFVGFLIPSSRKLSKFSDEFIRYLVIVILTYIGIELAQVEKLYSQIGHIITQVTLLSFLTISSGIIGLILFDKIYPNHTELSNTNEIHNVSIRGSLIQISSVLVGFIIGLYLPEYYMPPKFTITVLLMILILIVGIGLKGSGITLREVLLNKRGVQISIVFTACVLMGGVVYAILSPDVTISKGLALSSGFGWYSLSAVVMTESYGAIWGSIALFNDLIREFFSLIFIPFIMRKSISAGVSVGGATSIDFTLPVIQQSGGITVVPLAISFGFIVNILSPILMMFFASLG